MTPPRVSHPIQADATTPAARQAEDGDRLFGPFTARVQAQYRLARLFAKAGVETASLDARVLLCGALGIDHAALIRDPEPPLGDAAATLQAFADRRLAAEPVSRILGRREFWGLPFTIAPSVLDPRPDTEVLVEAVLAALGDRRHESLRILDLGTGSGAILGALLHECRAARGLGLDRSFEACVIARDNLRALGLGGRGAVVTGSWDDALAGAFDVVVSNPPYIAHDAIEMLDPDVRCYDPLAALDGGVDGLDPYRAIVPRLLYRLRPGGIAALEGGSTQCEAIVAMMTAAGLSEIAVRHDLAGRAGVVIGRRDGSGRP